MPWCDLRRGARAQEAVGAAPRRAPIVTGAPRGWERRLRSLRSLRWLSAAAAALVVICQVACHLAVALGERGLMVVSSCVRADGAVAWWGQQLALVRTAPSCPEGTFALGGSPSGMAAVVVSVALPALVVHLLAGGVAAGLTRAVWKWMCVVGHLLASVLRSLPALATPPPVGAGALWQVVTDESRWHERRRAMTPVRRGPPSRALTSARLA